MALFDVDDANVVNCVPVKVSGMVVTYDEIGNQWFSAKEEGD